MLYIVHVLLDPSHPYSHPQAPHCVLEAEQELENRGLTVAGWATYQNEEDFSDSIRLCEEYDRRISSSRVYYRLVLPTEEKRSGFKTSRTYTESQFVVQSFHERPRRWQAGRIALLGRHCLVTLRVGLL